MEEIIEHYIPGEDDYLMAVAIEEFEAYTFKDLSYGSEKDN